MLFWHRNLLLEASHILLDILKETTSVGIQTELVEEDLISLTLDSHQRVELNSRGQLLFQNLEPGRLCQFSLQIPSPELLKSMDGFEFLQNWLDLAFHHHEPAKHPLSLQLFDIEPDAPPQVELICEDPRYTLILGPLNEVRTVEIPGGEKGFETRLGLLCFWIRATLQTQYQKESHGVFQRH